MNQKMALVGHVLHRSNGDSAIQILERKLEAKITVDNNLVK